MSYKLILLDIFSYSCMNCLRSLEFIKKIDAKYKKYGLSTILVHTPEWKFEKESKNIINALNEYKIRFPVIIDSDKKIIKKLKIDFWPTQILFRNNKILYKHIGEGNHKELENAIIKILKIKSKILFNNEPKYSKFPTVYCGKIKKGKILNPKNKLKFGIVYTNEKWRQKNEFIESTGKQNSLTILTKGKIVNFVAKSVNRKSTKINIKLNNKIIKKIIINKPNLYNLIKLNSKKQHRLTIITKKGLAIYSFSFQ